MHTGFTIDSRECFKQLSAKCFAFDRSSQLRTYAAVWGVIQWGWEVGGVSDGGENYCWDFIDTYNTIQGNVFFTSLFFF